MISFFVGLFIYMLCKRIFAEFVSLAVTSSQAATPPQLASERNQ